MNTTDYLSPVIDEFGNTHYVIKHKYTFEEHIFQYIKEFLLPKRVEAVLHLLNDKGRWNIINTLENGLVTYKNDINYTQKQPIHIIPSKIFDTKYFTTNVFVEIINTYNDRIICNVFEPYVKKKYICLEKCYTINNDLTFEVVGIKEHNIIIYGRTNIKLGTVYIDKKKHEKQLNTNFTNFEEKISTSELKKIYEMKNKYGEHIINNFINNNDIEFLDLIN